MRTGGVKSRYVWGGFSPTILLRPIIWLAKHSFYREDRDSEFSERKGLVPKSRRLSEVYHRVVLADYVLQMPTRVSMPLLMGHSIVCDRYLHDTVINTALVLDYSDGKLLCLLERMQRLVPRPDWIFMADLAEEIAFSRKDDVPSIAFLEERRRRYQLIAQAQMLPILRASQPVEVLVQQILTEISQTRVERQQL
jgi:dTMP kinase